MTERFDVARFIPFPAEQIFAILRDPEGHVAIDSTGMLQSCTGEPVNAVGDRFVVHMDRESLNDYPLGKYDVEVEFITYEPNREIAWTIHGQIKPSIGHVYGYHLEPDEHEGVAGTKVTSYYDWSRIAPQWRDANIFPIIPEAGLRATLGILERTIARQNAT